MAIQSRTRVPSAAANGRHGHTLISDTKFRQLYALALKLRLLAQGGNGHGEAARALAGREAALAGVAADLRASDRVLVRETPLLAEALGVVWPAALTPTESGGYTQRLIEAVSGAAADQMQHNHRVTVIFCDEFVDRKVFVEARRIANAARLPVLFVEDRREGKEAPPEPREDKPPLPGSRDEEIAIPVDAQDVVAIYRVAHESIARAREGTGSTRIECVSWKPAVSRRKPLQAESTDAVEHLESWLEARGLPAQNWRRQIVAEFRHRMQEPDGASRPSTLDGTESANIAQVCP